MRPVWIRTLPRSYATLQEYLDLLRSLTTIACVALLSAGLAHLQNARGQRQLDQGRKEITWVRTADGWEDSDDLWLQPSSRLDPSLHPGLVAAFQLSTSLIALLAFSDRGNEK